jgi:hypothetical protein
MFLGFFSPVDGVESDVRLQFTHTGLSGME